VSTAPYRIRRATVDDLAQLRPLWQTLGLDAADLEKRLTEFQVAEGADGKLVGGVALQMAQGSGLIHSEVFVDFAVADQVRPFLWERLQAIATNHGLFRIWTREQAPFWSRCGLLAATEAQLAKLPEAWRVKNTRWLTLQLREQTTATLSVEREFERFMQSEKARSQAALEQAKMLKTIATVVALILAVVVIGAALYFLKRNPQVFAP
jgi:N-acetylglutamate synthase-like GNAT family acetyltransferase